MKCGSLPSPAELKPYEHMSHLEHPQIYIRVKWSLGVRIDTAESMPTHSETMNITKSFRYSGYVSKRIAHRSGSIKVEPFPRRRTARGCGGSQPNYDLRI